MPLLRVCNVCYYQIKCTVFGANVLLYINMKCKCLKISILHISTIKNNVVTPCVNGLFWQFRGLNVSLHPVLRVVFFIFL